MTNVDGNSICSRIERLIEEYEQSREPDSTEIGRQFAQLQRIMMENKDIYPSIEGAKPNNRLKNRYKDVLPYDKYRVILQSDNDSDYINASFIEDFYNDRRYIAAQGPIDESITDFIRMIWEFQITSIICTANEIEAGRFKFRRYWPEDEDSLQFGPYRITIDETNDKTYSCEHYKIRPLIITQGENERHVLLYHFLHWYDHDVPNDETSVLELLIRLYEDRSLSPDTPILVHCSAGCGRTGSIIAIDLCRLLIRNERLFLSKDFQPYPVFAIATHIRQFRIALIQTIKQYLFVHKVFVYIMKLNGNISLCSTINNDENQISNSTKLSSPSNIPSSARRPSGPLPIKLGNPPLGRRLTNGNNNNINNNNSPSTNVSSTKPPQSVVSDQPPPIPPRYSLLNTTNKRLEGQFVRSGEVPVKAKRTTLLRARNVKRRDVPPPRPNPRADSADALSQSSSSEHPYRPRTRRLPIQIEQGTNSD